ncbi:Os03g0718150, partial [Oryza sativa Japonica Group]
MGESISFIDGDSVADTITRVQHNTCGTTTGIQREDGLDGDVHSRGVEGLKHDLGHLLTIGLGVERSLGEEDGVLLRGHTELVVEGVMPDLLHIIPVADDTMLDGVLEGQDTPLGLRLVADVGVLLAHSDHDTGVARAADNAGEDSPGRIISGEPSLTQTTSFHYRRRGAGYPRRQP